jgi:tripartite-type tricarboxylate transporter receptor subunit TctC
MRSSLRRGAILLGMVLPMLHIAPAGFAQEWPSKPITIIVPYAVGGNADSVARLVGLDVSRRLGQPVLIDNRPGANGNVGTAMVARADPDGARSATP